MGIRKTPRPAGAVRPCGCGGVPGSSPCAPGAPQNPDGSGRNGSSGSGGRRVPHPGPALLRVAAGHPSRPPVTGAGRDCGAAEYRFAGAAGSRTGGPDSTPVLRSGVIILE